MKQKASSGPVSGRNSATVLHRIAVVLPVACVIGCVTRYGFDAPYMDAWQLVPHLRELNEGTLTLADLWSQHNEHRIFFPRIIMLGLARLTQWNLRYELAVSVTCAVLMLGFIAHQVRRTDRALGITGHNWALPILSLVIFSMNQWRMWLWSWQLQVALSLLAVMAAIVFLARPGLSWRGLVTGILCGLVATYSFASGMALWPAGAVVLWLTRERTGSRPWLHTATWCLLGLMAVSAYLYGFEGGKQPFNVTDFYKHPLLFVQYYLAYLGAPMMNFDARLAVILGALGMGMALVLLLTLRRAGITRDLLAPYVAMLAYVLVCAGITAVGRSQYGFADATESRYIPFSNVLWIVNAILLFLCIRAPLARGMNAAPGAKRLAHGAIAVLTGLALACCAHGVYRADERWDAFVPGRQALVDGDTGDMLLRLHPRPEAVLELREVLVRHRLSVFAHEETGDAGSPEVPGQQ